MLVIVICVDAVPFSYLGPYGCEWIDTPALDRLAHESLVFDAALARDAKPGSLLDTCFPILAERARLGVPQFFISDQPQPGLRDRHLPGLDAKVVAETVLPENAWASVETLEASGRYRIPNPGADPQHAQLHEPQRGIDRWRQQYARESQRQSDNPLSIARVVDGALDWLERIVAGVENPTGTVWLEVGLMGSPWLPPEDISRLFYDEEAGILPLVDPLPSELGQLYHDSDREPLRLGIAARIITLDQHVARLQQGLERLGLADRALIVFTADQGFPLGEHEEIGLMVPTGNSPVLPWTERMQIPLFIRSPTAAWATRTHGLCQPIDTAATMAEALGLALPFAEPAYSAWPVTHGAVAVDRPFAVMTRDHRVWAIQTRTGKLMSPLEPSAREALLAGQPVGADARYFFLKPEDRWDVVSVTPLHVDQADELEQILREWYQRHGDGNGEIDKVTVCTP